MSIGRLRRKLDLDLIARIKAGTVFEPKPMKRTSDARKGKTYRASRRNEMLRGEVKTVWRGVEARYSPVGGGSKLYKPNGKGEVQRRLRQQPLAFSQAA